MRAAGDIERGQNGDEYEKEGSKKRGKMRGRIMCRRERGENGIWEKREAQRKGKLKARMRILKE